MTSQTGSLLAFNKVPLEPEGVFDIDSVPPILLHLYLRKIEKARNIICAVSVDLATKLRMF